MEVVMKRKIIISSVVVSSLLLAWVIWRAFFASDLVNELPPYWDVNEIAEAALPYGSKGPVHVLAWTILEDDRPMLVESCLVLREREDGAGYQLTHLYRHPTGADAKWQLSQMHVSGDPGTKYFPGMWILHSKRFDKRPTNEKVYAALGQEDLGWSFEIDKSWTRVRCHVCENNWQQAIGEAPTQFFVMPQRGALDFLRLNRWLGRQ
jgi:hypothetical protein